MSEQEEQPNNIQKQLDAEKQRSEEYLNRLKYLQADFENLRKRCDRQVEETKNYVTERIMLDLLDVVDELELAVRTGETSHDVKLLVEGVQMTLKKFRKVLEREGVSAIKCEGQVFDPIKHTAIEKVEREGVKGCIVGEEVRKGYMIKGKVIRPSAVKVEVAPPEVSSSQDQKEKENEEKKREE